MPAYFRIWLFFCEWKKKFILFWWQLTNADSSFCLSYVWDGRSGHETCCTATQLHFYECNTTDKAILPLNKTFQEILTDLRWNKRVIIPCMFCPRKAIPTFTSNWIWPTNSASIQMFFYVRKREEFTSAQEEFYNDLLWMF